MFFPVAIDWIYFSLVSMKCFSCYGISLFWGLFFRPMHLLYGHMLIYFKLKYVMLCFWFKYDISY